MNKFMFLPVLIATAFTATAQQPSVPLTIEQAMATALSDNPEIKANEYEEAAAAQERKAAVGLRMPQVGLTGAYIHTQKRFGFYFNDLKEPVGNVLNNIGQTGLIPDAVLGQAQALLSRDWGLTLLRQDLTTFSGTVTMPIFTGGKINAANNAARINEQSAISRGEQSQNALISEVVERYYGYELALNVLTVRQQVVDAMQRHLDDAVKLEENGIIARAERLLVEVKKTEADRDYITAWYNAQNVLAGLCNTLNAQRDFKPVSSLFTLEGIERLEFFQDAALQFSPLLQEVELQKFLAVEGLRLERSEYYPQLAAMGGYTIYRHNLSDRVPRWAVGVGLKFNIFDGTQRERKVAAAKHTISRVEQLEVKAQNQLTTLIETIYNEMQTVDDKMASLDKSVEFAEEYLRIRNIGFREGVATATEVVDAELNLASVRIERLVTAYSYDLMLARLLEASGISDRFLEYAHSTYAMPVTLDKK